MYGNKREGKFRQEMRRILLEFKQTGNLYRLCKRLLLLMKKCKYYWQVYYILDNFDDIFKEIYPDEYVVETL